VGKLQGLGGPRHGGQACVVRLDEERHQEGNEGGQERVAEERRVELSGCKSGGHLESATIGNDRSMSGGGWVSTQAARLRDSDDEEDESIARRVQELPSSTNATGLVARTRPNGFVWHALQPFPKQVVQIGTASGSGRAAGAKQTSQSRRSYLA
jgi:hypothetical protein